MSFIFPLSFIIFFVGLLNIVLSNTELYAKRTTLFSIDFFFVLSLFFWVFINSGSSLYFFPFSWQWSSIMNQQLSFGVDSLSLFFVILTSFLVPICVRSSWTSVKSSTKLYFALFLVLDFLLLVVFLSTDILLFYLSFEAVLIPMYILINTWGSRQRKIRAGYLFFFYTLIGSFFMLLGIIYMFVYTGSSSFEIVSTTSFGFIEQKWLWFSFFLSLAAKIPLFPFHIWLPEAHVEAPTAGSVLLAGVLLKLGSYGFLRFSMTLFPLASLYYSPLVFTLGIMGVIFGSLSALRQTDFKRIIAYSSVAHMNLVMLGIFSFNTIGIEGSIFQSLSHGFVSSALFLLIGVLYDRAHSREIYYFSGIVQVMPLFSAFFLLFTMANIALPSTSSFVGEFLILMGVFKFSTIACFFGATGMVLGGAYSLWLLNRVIYGNIKIEYMSKYQDTNLREFLNLTILLVCSFVFGIFPEFILETTHSAGLSIMCNYYKNASSFFI